MCLGVFAVLEGRHCRNYRPDMCYWRGDFPRTDEERIGTAYRILYAGDIRLIGKDAAASEISRCKAEWPYCAKAARMI